MKLIQTIVILLIAKLTLAQCLLPTYSRGQKKIKIGVTPLKIYSNTNQVHELISGYDYFTSEIKLYDRDRTKIVGNVNSLFEKNSINPHRFKFRVESLFKLRQDSIKSCCPLLSEYISGEYGYYCEGQIHIEKNVYIQFPLILDKSYKIVFGDFRIIRKLPVSILSICKVYSLLKNLDQKIGLLDIVRISIETAGNHTNLIFELTD